MSSAPTKYVRVGNFTGSAVQGGTWTTAAPTLDAELNSLKTVTDKLIDRLDELQRDDGGLELGVVTPDTLASTVTGTLASYSTAASSSASAASTSATAAAASAASAAASAEALQTASNGVFRGVVFGGTY